VLEGNGVRIDGDSTTAVNLRFGQDGQHHDQSGDSSFTSDQILENIGNGKWIVTFTARHGEQCDVEHPQPAIWSVGPIEKQRGAQKFPVLYPGESEMLVSGRNVDQQARVFLDGHRVDGKVSLKKNERIAINLKRRPENGMHLLQLQNPGGQFSNDFILTVAQAKPTDDDENAGDAKQPKPKTLAEALRRSGWDRLVGTWVNEGSQGEGPKMTVKWKIKDRVVEMESIDPGRTSVSLISINAASGDIFQVGADSTGSSHLGTWKFQKTGDAVLNLGYTDGNGTQGEITLRYKLVDDDTLDFSLALPQPIHVRLIRASE
jgi:hypothetical protein